MPPLSPIEVGLILSYRQIDGWVESLASDDCIALSAWLATGCSIIALPQCLRDFLPKDIHNALEIPPPKGIQQGLLIAA